MLRVGVGAARPKPLSDVSKFPLAAPRRGRRGVDRVDHDVDPDRRLLRLDELRQPELVGRVRRQQVHGRVREARRGDELLRVLRVVRRARDLRRVVPGGVRRRDQRAARLHEAAEDDPVQRVAVDRLLERLPQLRARGERRADVRVRQVAGAVLVADVDDDARASRAGAPGSPAGSRSAGRPSSSVVETWSSTWMSPAFSAAAAAAASGIGLKTILSR